MRARLDNQLQELIGRVYEAAIDPERWRAIDAYIAAAFGAIGSSLAITRKGPEARLLDPADADGGSVLAPFTIFVWERDTWERSRDHPCNAFCTEWCQRSDVCYVLGASFSIAGGEVGQLRLLRDRAGGCFEPGTRSRVAALLPHLRRALQLRQRVDQAALLERVNASALDGAMMAAFVVDAELQLLHANARGRAMLEPGGTLRLSRGRLTAPAPHSGPALAQLVRTATGGAPGDAAATRWLRLDRGPGRSPLTLTVAPLTPDKRRDATHPLALILLRDPEQVRASPRALQQLFDLTPAEAGVAQAIATGGSLEQVAQSLQISLNTVKTHLHRIFDKTATSRQGELVALIHNSTANYAAMGTEYKINNLIHPNDAMEGLSDYTGPTEWPQ